MRIGLDIGSTTIKAVVMDDTGVIYSDYSRHYSTIGECAVRLLSDVVKRFPHSCNAYIAITGSAGMGLSEKLSLPFVQEVHAARTAIQSIAPETDVAIELGGEDAKILFLSGRQDSRMNGSCAGGTGAFIDQMAALLNRAPNELNELAKDSTSRYTIASRCGVFAKSDIQPLLNQGARKQDIAAGIFGAVVSQTISGLAAGRPIEGNVLYLGGPLTFFSELRRCFDETLGLTGRCPEHSLYFAAIGAALCAEEYLDTRDVLDALTKQSGTGGYESLDPLFDSPEAYGAFRERHERASVARESLSDYDGGVFIGIDAGSTTVKMAVIGQDGQLLDTRYKGNSGNPVPLVGGFLHELYDHRPDIDILGCTVTGYGEDLIRNAFNMDYGIVETMAHYLAARFIQPDVDFILDIGGQDIKCMRISNGVIDNIYLNEACSSGCGSFLQSFAGAMGYTAEAFAELGLYAERPVDLGSRCTVFMNSSVKQAQKDGASTDNISAGLSISVVKNALYKVIRVGSGDELGRHIVVQGGTFYNDVVLRAFELETGQTVTRPDIAGLMGAYGAALYALEKHNGAAHSSVLSNTELAEFSHEVKLTRCGMCSNNCQLTVNRFGSGRRYIGGNRCERPVAKSGADNDTYNLYSYKRELILRETPPSGSRPVVGIPLGLNMYELLPFWRTFFDKLGIDVITGPLCDRELYLSGQNSVPSDTVCYPAKLMHGQIEALIARGVQTIFYPCMSYNTENEHGDNCFNCPVVAYYPEVLNANMPSLKNIRFIYGHMGLHNKKEAAGKLYKLLKGYYPNISKSQVSTAVQLGYAALDAYMAEVAGLGRKVIDAARKEGKPIIVLAGRPYHIDPEINHGIDKLITSLNMAVVSEDAVAYGQLPPELQVINQWTYHGRLYASAEYAAHQPDMQFVQLVSFGCGFDAVTTDECRRITEDAGKIYTQIKVDEIDSLGAAKIRLRSLMAAVDMEESQQRSKLYA